jgi:hypothetical protein
VAYSELFEHGTLGTSVGKSRDSDMTATQTKSTIKRSWKTTISYLIAAAVAGAISVVMFMTIVGGAISFGFACIPAILCVIFLFMAASGAGECPCPGCGKPRIRFRSYPYLRAFCELNKTKPG